jgi:putative exosortase-associated protein (TIGR04073 family)
MRTSNILLAAVLIASALGAGCAGPEQKLGRGLRNSAEFLRLGEIQRSMEQTYLWDGTSRVYTDGFIRGFNRSVVRTALGLYEILTFPLPPYGPLLTSTNLVFPDPSVATLRSPWGGLVLPADPVYPDSHAPNIVADQIFATDEFLGFSGGDIAPMVPGSRFKIFDH